MTTWRVTAVLLAVVVGAMGCSGSDDDGAPATTRPSTTTSSTTTTPERPASTTTTAYDPAAIEGQVEAAYLRSWDVYAAAVYDLVLDEAALAEVYAEDALDTQVAEIERRIAEDRPSLVRVDHAYSVVVSEDGTANVVDQFVNHQVRVDPETRAPIEADPNSRSLLNFRMRRFGTAWKVVFIERVTS